MTSLRALLESEIPEEIILSILTDYSKADTDSIIEQIITKLQRATKSKTELERAIQQLLVLSRLRNLETETRKKATEMPITYDITTDGLYKEGIEQGIEQGIERGIEQGKINVIKKALFNKKLTIEEIADLADVSVDFVLSIQTGLK